MIQRTEFRVVKTDQGFFEIHEVYLDNKGNPITSSIHATKLRESSINDLKAKLELIRKATLKPTLNSNLVED